MRDTPLTKRQALELTRDLWQWLAENPKREKLEWPGWHEHGYMNANCPCCQYTIDNDPDGKVNCSMCPLITLWPVPIRFCLDPSSPYIQWRDDCIHVDVDGRILCSYDPVLRTKYAQQIADAAASELSRLAATEQGGISLQQE